MIDPVRNFARVTALLGYDQNATTIALNPGEGALLPPTSEGAFNLVWYNASDFADPADDPGKEIIRVIARNSDTLTITRAQEGTNAQPHNTPGKVYRLLLALTAVTMDLIRKGIDCKFEAILDGSTSFVNVTIPGLTVNSRCRASWGLNADPDPNNAFGPPVGSLYISAQNNGSVDVRSNAQENANRRIVVEVYQW